MNARFSISLVLVILTLIAPLTQAESRALIVECQAANLVGVSGFHLRGDFVLQTDDQTITGNALLETTERGTNQNQDYVLTSLTGSAVIIPAGQLYASEVIGLQAKPDQQEQDKISLNLLVGGGHPTSSSVLVNGVSYRARCALKEAQLSP